jgi:predicted HTH domain antitoxin
MPVTISDEVLAAAHISEPELMRELALALFRQERLTLAQASRLAEMTQLAFQALLADRQIPIHYGVEEFPRGCSDSSPAGTVLIVIPDYNGA